MKTNNIKSSFSIFSCVLLFSLSACSSRRSAHQLPDGHYTLGGKLYTSAWIQHSAEYKALCLQAYNVATDRIDHLTSAMRPAVEKPIAIVTDIDETILDNTPNSVHEALKGNDYNSESWTEWCNRAEADTLAGAVRFFQHAADKGVTVFYISNRNAAERDGTLRNLRKFGFPYADEAHLLTRENTSDKQARRDEVLRNYEIVMYLGDNLGDFHSIFDSADPSVRDKALDSFASEFGHCFIVLPNPNYGTWHKAMNGGYFDLKTQDEKLLKVLKTY
ncbi:acid phosphatase [Porphyromonas crevioricanis JCM 15906]|uniref:5'-nucleotidase n=2 Tax=Porphyromonas crevioricanis TaxID=393921 RepID=A0A2X4PG24_9PORP|nr:5'-nucleotidase, lipoprotein e(P4) family [Porphyromonas crevioricanis]KGN93982.1 5'-nucleotidase [Porphyromonas crevioricanis]SJZ63116.1 5'-nucleotidase, lipoprotein e(P4) family [Porphyromonas crevioricanis]SQH72876.1 Outer membrane protein P4 [Porphyromonas crevioricanis]GAD05749.1 acid phosphatase [Porphyromonas crevioricanis JCM 15906]GAD06957.1 acid phosphatase [Porphyromonas crevioricanis JCM 13913]